MCYTVVIAKDRCSHHHPDPTTAQLCWRQCATQARRSRETGQWDRICENISRQTKILITADVKVSTVRRDDCTVCITYKNDAILGTLKGGVQDYEVEKANMTQRLEELDQDIEKMDDDNVPRSHPRYRSKKAQLKEVQDRFTQVKFTIDKLKDEIINRKESIRLANEDNAGRNAENSCRGDLSYYLRNRVSTKEEDARRAWGDYPRHFPRRMDRVSGYLDRYGILDADILIDDDGED